MGTRLSGGFNKLRRNITLNKLIYMNYINKTSKRHVRGHLNCRNSVQKTLQYMGFLCFEYQMSCFVTDDA